MAAEGFHLERGRLLEEGVEASVVLLVICLVLLLVLLVVCICRRRRGT